MAIGTMSLIIVVRGKGLHTVQRKTLFKKLFICFMEIHTAWRVHLETEVPKRSTVPINKIASHFIIHPSFLMVLELDLTDISPFSAFFQRGSLTERHCKPEKWKSTSFLYLMCCFSTWQPIQWHLGSQVAPTSAVHKEKLWPTPRIFLFRHQAGHSFRTTVVMPSWKIFHYHVVFFITSSKFLYHWQSACFYGSHSLAKNTWISALARDLI